MRQNRLLMQFHITGRCNLRCKHCYRTEGDVENLSYDDVINIIEQYKRLRIRYNKYHSIRCRGHINITGGEPFVRKDIGDIIRYLGECRDEFSFGILSNGSFIDDEMISVLKSADVSFVQLSIDGDRETHDFLRAKGDYDRVLDTAEYLEQNGVRTYISFTANRDNFKHLPEVARECRRRGITKLWSDRLVPIGTGEELKNLAITSDIFPDYMAVMRKAQGNFITKTLNRKTIVTTNRALQFLYSDGDIYSCSAGDSLITVDEFGRVMPCRRLPIYCGDVFTERLEDIYFGNETLKALRLRFVPDECRQCEYSFLCRGGARCQSFAAYGTAFRADPACLEINSEK